MSFALLFLIINLIFFGAIAYYFLVVRRQLNEERKVELGHQAFEEEKLEEAELELKDELQEVRIRANKILAESENIARELIVELENTLGKKHADTTVPLPSEDNFEVELGSLSNKIKSHYVIRIQNLLKSLEKYELQEARKVEAFAQDQMESADKNLQSMRISALSKMHEKIERYKEEELMLFDKKVKEVIDQAAQEVLGHSLTNQDIDESILKALEKAKEQHKL